MRMSKISSAEDYKLLSSFQSVRQVLRQPEFNDRLEKPLAYWALPNDRRLPLAFLGRTVGDLLETPFEELSATPGVGQKKITSLVKLLHRATQESPPMTAFNDLAVELTGTPQNGTDVSEANGSNGSETNGNGAEHPFVFDPDLVSEVMWDQWRKTHSTTWTGKRKVRPCGAQLE